ncbi:tetratricopeptide repeat protein [Microcoleus sp. AT9_B5]
MVQRFQTAVNQKQLWLGLVPLISLSGITCLLLNSRSFAAIPEQMAPKIAQQPANSNAAKQVLEEGVQLAQQGTAESLRQAIPKFEQAVTLSRQAGDKPSEALSFVGLGRVHNLLGENQKALEFFNQALPLFREVGDRGREATTLANIGAVYSALGEKQKALEYYNQALPLYQAVGNRGGQASILNNIGAVYDSWGEKQKALEFLNQALPLLQAVGDRGGEANTLNNIGKVYSDLGEKQKALESYNQALPLIRAVGDKRREASILTNIGTIYFDLGENQKALEYLNQALPLRRAMGDRGGEANTLTNIAGVYNSWGEKQKALEYLNQALPLIRAVGDRGGEASILNGIGGVYSDLGENQKALEFFNQALPLRRAMGDRGGEAATLNNIASVYNSWGEKQKALDFYNQALPLLRAVGDRSGEASILNGIGGVYSDLGENQKALEFFNQALPLRRAVGDRSGEVVTLNGIGLVYDSWGEKQKALELFNQALSLIRAVGDRGWEAITLNNIGYVYNSLGEKQKTLELFNQALSLFQAVGDRGLEAGSLNNIGRVYYGLGEKQKALEYYNQALPITRAVGNKDGEAGILYNIALLQRSQGNLKQALTLMENSITIIEDLRTKIGSQELRTSYFATVQDYYQFYIDLLMQLHQQNPSQGYDALALHASERARARSLLEQLTEAGLNLKADLDPALKAEEQRLTQALNAADQRRINLLKQYDNPKLEEVKAEIDNILNQFQNLEARIRAANPAYANLKYPEPLTLPEIQTKILDDKTLLLQYALGKDRSYLFLVSKTDLKTYKLPPKAEIEAALEQYRTLLQSPDFTDLSQGQNLSQMLLGQIAGELKEQRLAIVGDGKLQLLPFAALPWGSGASLAPLLKNHEIITLPSATSLAVQREQWQKRQQASRTLAVIADPVFKANDPRLGENATTTIAGDLSQVGSLIRNSCGDFDRLPHTAIEAEQILALVPDAQEFSALGFDANYATATNPNLSQYRIVHLATHGCIQDNPLLSNLALSFFNADGQKAETSLLKLQDIYNLELNADLVVLSACQTGTGKEVQGEGIVGLTRGFMYAGARRVAVSLWSVNDRATSILMSDYYRQMLEQKVDPAAALRQAQLAMWQSDSYSAPYYWAAFTLQGDW